MIDTGVFDKTFEKENFSGKVLTERNYDNCTFIECNFLKAEFSNITFVDCRFVACDISLSKLFNTGMKTVSFDACKMIGLTFSDCSDFLFACDFKDCQMDMCSFIEMPLKSSSFKGTSLREVDFSDADLSKVVFSSCNLDRAIFQNTRLEKTDFRTALNYAIDPELNKMSGARFSTDGLVGLLTKYKIKID